MFWFSMMSASGANPIFSNKKKKIRRLVHSPTPPLPFPTSDNISFLPYPHPPQSGRHYVYHPYKN